jgi:hypothetical protein
LAPYARLEELDVLRVAGEGAARLGDSFELEQVRIGCDNKDMTGDLYSRRALSERGRRERKVE